jgi:hypothetical protein
VIRFAISPPPNPLKEDCLKRDNQQQGKHNRCFRLCLTPIAKGIPDNAFVMDLLLKSVHKSSGKS